MQFDRRGLNNLTPFSSSSIDAHIRRFSTQRRSFFLLGAMTLLYLFGYSQESLAQVASVNGVPIDSNQYRAHYLRLLESHPNVKGNDRLEQRLAQRAMIPLVIELLLREEVQRTQFDLTQLKYEDPLNQLRAMYKDHNRVKDYLVRTGDTEASLRLKRWREEVTYALMTQQGLLKITDEEIQAEYDRRASRLQQPDQMQAHQILLELSSTATTEEIDAQRLKAEEIYQKIKKNEISFETAVWTYSEGPRKFKRGSLGMISRGQLVEPVENALWALKEGEISQPVRSRYGWHILSRGASIKGKKTSFESAREKLLKMLTKSKYSRNQHKFIKKLWENAKIESSLPLRY